MADWRRAVIMLTTALLISLPAAFAAPGDNQAAPVPAERDIQTRQVQPQSGVDSGRAHDALLNGRNHKRRGDLLAAIRAYQEAYIYSAPDSYIRTEARDELQFHLPLMRVHQLLLAGEREEAETIVKRLQAFHGEDAERQKVLGEVLARVQDPAFLPAPKPKPASAEQVMDRVRQKLEVFRRENDDYPRGYTELNELLPANTPPLDQFDIVSYSRNGSGYRLEIRAKRHPYNTYKIEKTGLLR